MKITFLLLLMLALSVNADMLPRNQIKEILPEDYGKFGITPFVGPLHEDGSQETTVIFNRTMYSQSIKEVALHFLSSKKILILKSNSDYECREDKCFVIFHIVPDYQNNIELELVYAGSGSDDIQNKYIIKEIGLLTSRINRKR